MELKILQVTRGMENLDYDNLCIHPDIDMSVGYKPPKPKYDTKAVPWDYRVGAMGKMIDTIVTQGMTRSGRCYAQRI